MKGTLFKKSAALAIGSIFTFSATAFASTYHEIIYGNRLSNSQTLVVQRQERQRPGTQCQDTLQKDSGFPSELANAESALANVKSVGTGGVIKSNLAELIAQALSLIENAKTLARSTASSDKRAVARVLNQAENLLSDALAMAKSDTVSGPGKLAILQSIASAKTSLGNTVALVESYIRRCVSRVWFPAEYACGS
ncbi:hypothetical protein [Nostoc sp. TCL26-01]|uniref:hypothetical protein n=1 Tax=Nostoc sp. TCL26-01 TaxID=2576904 RepID=UPI0015BC0483|nr:hypothetical protein [Nostoc sp. TCL26-01]QLE58263.1 hypothetical protein FD725_23760 [Nostoc sp. TCL26-01]